MKLLTVVIPCYNSAAYMEKAVESAVSGGEEMDVLIVDDGSKDETGEIADRFRERYPSIVRVIHQENGGHGEGINQGIRTGLGIYMKVLDSDDRIDTKYLPGLLDILRVHAQPDNQVDLIVHDYVYDHSDEQSVFSITYKRVFPENRVLSWDDVHRFALSNQFMIHCLVYRTAMLRDEMKLELPKHYFYEDNLYIYRPLPYTKKIIYYHAPLHGYLVGRGDQSVNRSVIMKRLPMMTDITVWQVTSYHYSDMLKFPKRLRQYMLNNTCGQISTTSAMQFESSDEGLRLNKEMWDRIKAFDEDLYHAVRRNPLGATAVLPGKLGRKLLVWGYKAGRKLIKFT